MAILPRINNSKRGLLPRLRSSIILLRFSSNKAKGAVKDKLSTQMSIDYSACLGSIGNSRWKKLDASRLGITGSMISRSSWTVLNLLKSGGFESYLVGGCVRDLLLNRIPKDFDVITTANLTQIKKQFRRAAVVGRHFPICMVPIKGSVIEVSSFETVARTHTEEREIFLSSLMPKGCNEKDLILFKNSLQRDFTINSLFYDPFARKIYDYANGLADLKSMKLQTLIPAQLSFKEDPGRILRALRIAARLGLSLSREITSAIQTFYLLVKDLNKFKIMMEMNYMLSYGAAKPSLSLLWKFKLLDFLLPLHAAYLDQQAIKQDAQASSMLMKLFFHLDKLVACDRPSACTAWIGLLAIHLALVNNPQDALVVWALASVLYHGVWEKGVEFAKEQAKRNVYFSPEIRKSSVYKSDEEIVRAVSQLASLVVDSITDLVNENILLQSVSRYPSASRFGLVFIPSKTGKDVAQLFKVLIRNVDSYRSEKKDFEINYDLFRRGHPSEIRFVLGKVILETMSSGIIEKEEVLDAKTCEVKTEEDSDEPRNLSLPDPLNSQLVETNRDKRCASSSNPRPEKKKIKKHKFVQSESIPDQRTSLEKQELFEMHKDEETARKIPKLSKSNPRPEKMEIKKHKLVQSGSIPDRTSLEKHESFQMHKDEETARNIPKSSKSNPRPEKKEIKKHKLVQSESIPDQTTSLEKHDLFEIHKDEETARMTAKLSKLFK
ncbi:hypothetical protein QN277_004635 [Acacia crassicarpa]|uniref:Poly(A) polymerase n=1 Tax=Acacia crassicarpa TaxID=499986 RepID=A0AAE1J0T2_9FABA|nr:hypothetical protein QN277_004635 [Acacia crassicarpa]